MRMINNKCLTHIIKLCYITSNTCVRDKVVHYVKSIVLFFSCRAQGKAEAHYNITRAPSGVLITALLFEFIICCFQSFSRAICKGALQEATNVFCRGMPHLRKPDTWILQPDCMLIMPIRTVQPTVGSHSRLALSRVIQVSGVCKGSKRKSL